MNLSLSSPPVMDLTGSPVTGAMKPIYAGLDTFLLSRTFLICNTEIRNNPIYSSSHPNLSKATNNHLTIINIHLHHHYFPCCRCRCSLLQLHIVFLPQLRHHQLENMLDRDGIRLLNVHVRQELPVSIKKCLAVIVEMI